MQIEIIYLVLAYQIEKYNFLMITPVLPIVPENGSSFILLAKEQIGINFLKK